MFATIYSSVVAVLVVASFVLYVFLWRHMRRRMRENETAMREWERKTYQMLADAMHNEQEEL